ncbi:MAG: hypothetical protein PUC06_09345 [Oscillospiraceae bacterium]|nr:hypothetical protein [Oscillospiraceae bacterium]
MTKYHIADVKEKTGCINRTLLLMFLIGCVLGCGLCILTGIRGVLFPGVTDTQMSFWEFALRPDPVVLAACIRLCVPVFLLGLTRWGAALIPAWFGIEGLLLSGAVCAFTAGNGLCGLFAAGILLSFRLLILLPYSFLLGSWAVDRSLRFDWAPGLGNAVMIGIITVFAAVGTALLECSLGRWLSCLYFLSYGV